MKEDTNALHKGTFGCTPNYIDLNILADTKLSFIHSGVLCGGIKREIIMGFTFSPFFFLPKINIGGQHY